MGLNAVVQDIFVMPPDIDLLVNHVNTIGDVVAVLPERRVDIEGLVEHLRVYHDRKLERRNIPEQLVVELAHLNSDRVMAIPLYEWVVEQFLPGLVEQFLGLRNVTFSDVPDQTYGIHATINGLSALYLRSGVPVETEIKIKEEKRDVDPNLGYLL